MNIRHCPKDRTIVPHGVTCRELCRYSTKIDSKITGAKLTFCHFGSNTLHLNLHRKWFDMILSGEKKEEYRDICSLYWIKRLCSAGWHKEVTEQRKKAGVGGEWVPISARFKDFDTVTFSNGYAKDRDQFEIELKGIKCSSDTREEWGAEPDQPYFVLSLGKILWKRGK